MAILQLDVNGETRRVDVDPERSLLGVLRDELDLTGSKYGCGEGQCGACTVLVDGKPARSCMAKVGSAAGHKITTIEGIESGGRLHPVQQAFAEVDALQCGYCTPGMIVEAVAFLRVKPDATEADVARGLEGHICRCGTYPRIVRAVRRAAEAMKGGVK